MRQITTSICVALIICAGVVRAGSVDVPVFLTEEQGMAAAISHPTPAYSKAALQLKMEGKVGITLCVNREGAVIDTVISYGNPVLTQMAVDGVKEWKFKPFHDESGKLVKAMFPITIDFHLPKKA